MQSDIHFRSLTGDDMTVLHEWVTRPHVAEWWGSPSTLEELRADYMPIVSGDGPHRAYIALEGEVPIGFIQSYVPSLCHDDGWWLDVHDPGVRGIDQFLADGTRLGQGVGRRMITAFVRQIFADPSVTYVQTDPSPENARAIRCYERCGFRAVGEIETVDGVALLMHLSRENVRQPS